MIDLAEIKKGYPFNQDEHYWDVIALAEQLQAENAQLKAKLHHAKNYSDLSAWTCPLCDYEEGVFVKHCSLHETITVLQAECQQLKTHKENPANE